MTETNAGSRRDLKMRTRLAAAGRRPNEQFGFVNTPIYRGSTVLFPTYADLAARTGRFSYGTQGTPTTQGARGGLERHRRRHDNRSDAIGPGGHPP